MVGVLVFANWGVPASSLGFWTSVYAAKWHLAGLLGAALAVMLVVWFHVTWWKVGIAAVLTAALAAIVPDEPLVPFAGAMLGLSIVTSTDHGDAGDWSAATWEFAKQILPLLLFGVLIAGGLLGRPGHEGLIPSEWVSRAVGGNSLGATLFASVLGAFMYFATLTEIPILQGLIDSGMRKGPALALLLAGPALSLPSMLVLRGVAWLPHFAEDLAREARLGLYREVGRVLAQTLRRTSSSTFEPKDENGQRQSDQHGRPPLPASLGPERHDRIEAGGSPRGVSPEEHADRGRNPECEDDCTR
jgi:hypothetical protein